MLNLNIIPPELKNKIHLNNIHKKIVSYFFVLLITLIVYGVFLFSVSLLLKNEYKNTINNASPTRDMENYIAKARDINTQVIQIEEIQNNIIIWSNTLTKLINNTNEGILVSSISLGKGNSRLVISGVATAREDLLQFKKNLNNLDFLNSINLPIESLLQKENIKFNITAEITSYEFSNLE